VERTFATHPLTFASPTGTMSTTMPTIEGESLRVTENIRPVPDRRRITGPMVAVALVSAALGRRFFLVIAKYSINVFFYDQWEYLKPFYNHDPGFAELFFLQHGIHREGIGLFADKFLYPLTHWDARVDSFFVGFGIFAAMLLALWLKCKLFGALSYSDVVIPVIFLTLAQSEALVSASNPACSGFPLAMIMLYCLALLRRNPLQRYSLILALNFLLIYTGYGLFMGVITLAVFLLECFWSWRRVTSVPLAQPLTRLLVAVASLGSFFFRYTLAPRVDCALIPHGHWLQYPQLTALMFSAFVVPRPLHVSLGMTALGVVILSAAVALLGGHLLRLLKGAANDADLTGVVLLSYSLLFAASAAVGRLCLGLEMAFSSRYVTLLIPAFLAIYFYLLSHSWHGKRNVVLAVWVLLLLPAAIHKPWEEVRWYSNGKRDWANCYVRTRNIRYCDQKANFWIHPYPGRIGLQQELDYLKQHRLNLFSEANPK
jgi:hypothetical protein